MTNEAPNVNPSAQKAIQTTGRRSQKASGNPSYDLIVQNLQLSGENWSYTPRSLGVTASAIGEGATTVAANLAITAANSTGQRVLLVDTNFQRPDATRLLRHRANQAGLLDVLAGDANLSDCVQNTRLDQLSVLAPGRHSKRKGLSECSVESIETLVEHLKYEFQLVVFDLPPTADTANCLRMVSILDGVLLVVSAGGVPREQVRRASKRLSRCGGKVLGVVLNKSDG